MFRQKREKFTVVTTPEKNHQHKPLVQLEGKLTQEELEAIGFASARSAIAAAGTSHQ